MPRDWRGCRLARVIHRRGRVTSRDINSDPLKKHSRDPARQEIITSRSHEKIAECLNRQLAKTWVCAGLIDAADSLCLVNYFNYHPRKDLRPVYSRRRLDSESEDGR